MKKGIEKCRKLHEKGAIYTPVMLSVRRLFFFLLACELNLYENIHFGTA